MCMSGDDRYADPKFLTIAELIGVEYRELYGTDSEIGRWMRTKNGIEKTGDYLFVHAGVSPEVVNIGLTIEEINNLIKPYYGQSITAYDPDNVYTLFKSAGIFWYRGYFKDNEGVYDLACQYEVNAILDYFDVSAVFVGHTIVDNINSKYDNAVYAIDVHHPEDALSDINFQALLIDGDNIYSVDEVGNRILLY